LIGAHGLRALSFARYAAPALLGLGVVACRRGDRAHADATWSIPTTQNLRAVWGNASNDVWAVGDRGTILHFDGRAWTISPSGTQESLTGAYGTGPRDVWVSGEKGAMLHWNGEAWSQIAAQGDDTMLLSVWASGPTDVWAVGIADESGFLRKWDGTKWGSQGIPGSSSLWGVAGTGPHDVWMIGNNPQGAGLVLHGDGSHFDLIGYKGPPARGIFCVRPDDVWVAPYEGGIEHWNGSTWETAPTTAGPLLRMAGSGTDDVWATGLGGVALHYRGGSWSSPPTGTNNVLWSIWSRAPEEAWAVGNSGTVRRWNGSAWSR
jgi:hypothetical protein